MRITPVGEDVTIMLTAAEARDLVGTLACGRPQTNPGTAQRRELIGALGAAVCGDAGHGFRLPGALETQEYVAETGIEKLLRQALANPRTAAEGRRIARQAAGMLDRLVGGRLAARRKGASR